MTLQERLDKVQNNLDAMMIRCDLMEIEIENKPTPETVISYLTKLIKLNKIDADTEYKGISNKMFLRC